MKPEDFTIEAYHEGGDDERGCGFSVDIKCPSPHCWYLVDGDTLGEVLEAARRHIAEKHAATASPLTESDGS